MPLPTVSEHQRQDPSRHTRDTLVLALALALAAVSCGFADAGAENNPGGQLSVTLLGDMTPPPGSIITLHAAVSNASYAVKSFSWTVADPRGEVVAVETQGYWAEDATFRAEGAGSYAIRCIATFIGTGAQLQETMTLQVEDDGSKLTYTVHIIPRPEQELPAQAQDILVGDVDLQQDLVLPAGREVTLSLTHQEAPLPAYVRLFQSSGLLALDRLLDEGSGRLSLLGGFHALILPLDDAVPPELLEHQRVDQLSDRWQVELDEGSQLYGRVLREGGEPLAGSVITLHAWSPGAQVKVPSTLGECDAQGQFQLRYRSRGATSLVVVPPVSAELMVAVAEDVLLSAMEETWQLVYLSAGAAPVSGRVLLQDGKTPGAGARVVLELAEPDEPVGRLIRGASEQPLWPRYRRDLIADAQGQLIDPSTGRASWQLPYGRYRAQGWPAPAAPSEQGHFQVADLRISAGGPADLAFTLGRRAQLEGKVVDKTGTAVRARVVAKAASGAFSVLNEQSGSFSLLVDPDQDYALSVQPQVVPGQVLSSQLLNGVRVDAGGRVIDIALQPAVLLSGRVVTTGGLSIPGATLRVWCSSAACPGKQILDETQSASNGSYQLRIPRQAVGQ